MVADRYVVVIKSSEGYATYTFSSDATKPNGVNMYHETTPEYEELEWEAEVDLHELPKDVLIAILQRLDSHYEVLFV